MDMKALMDELLEHGCILQSREALAQGIIEKHTAVGDHFVSAVTSEPEAVIVNDITFPERQAEQEENESEDDHAE